MAEDPKYELKTAYDGTKIRFYPTPHWYKIDGEKTYLLSPSGITGMLDKSEALLIWNANLMRDYFKAKIIETDQYSKTAIIEHLEIAINQRKTTLEEAQDVGTAIHDFAQHYAYAQVMKNQPLPTTSDVDADIYASEQVKNGKKAFLSLVAKHNIKFHDVEKFVYSKKYTCVPFVGHLDGVVEIDGVRCLIDWKSSKSVYMSQKYQLAGYDLAMEEEIEYKKARGLNTEHLEYEKLAIIHIDKNTGIPTIHYLSKEEREEYRKGFIALTMLKQQKKVYDKW